MLVPRVLACSSGASLFLGCQPVPRMLACSSDAILVLVRGSPMPFNIRGISEYDCNMGT